MKSILEQFYYDSTINHYRVICSKSRTDAFLLLKIPPGYGIMIKMFVGGRHAEEGTIQRRDHSRKTA